MKKIHFLLLASLVMAVAGANAQCNILATATTSPYNLTGGATSGYTMMSVAYNPVEDVYYGATTYPTVTYSGTNGNASATNTPGFNQRGIWWNPGTNQPEGNGYSFAGINSYNVNSSGAILTGYSSIFSGMYQPYSNVQ